MIPLSPKQIDVLTVEAKDINAAEGVTASGKTYAFNLRVMGEWELLGEGDQFLLTGATSNSLYKNVISEMLKLDGGLGKIRFQENKGRIVTDKAAVIHVVGMDSSDAAQRTVGGSVRGWYADEVTKTPRVCFDTASSRCRYVEDGEIRFSPAWMTFNPDDDFHFIYDVVDRKENVNYWKFEFMDNPTMTAEFIQKLNERYTGVFHDRMIKGIRTGDPAIKVFPEFDQETRREVVKRSPRPEYYHPCAGLDPGFSDLDWFGVVWGYYDFLRAKYVLTNELIIKKPNSSLDVLRPAQAIEEKSFKGRRIYLRPQIQRYSDIDLSLVRDFNALHNFPVSLVNKNFTKEDDAGLNLLAVLMKQRRLEIDPDCDILIRQLIACRRNKQRTDLERTETYGHFDGVKAAAYLVRSMDLSDPYPPPLRKPWDKTPPQSHPLARVAGRK